MSESEKTALVAGGAGFIGSHLTERLLAEGWRVNVIDLPTAPFANLAAVANDPKLNVLEADITTLADDHTIFEGVDEIYQCIMAGNHIASKDHPEMIFPPNLMPALRVLDVARTRGGLRVHLTSSSAVYGSARGHVDETAPTVANTPYGLAKLFQEQAMAFWHATYDVPTITYRLFACYGPRVTSGGVFSVFLRKIANGEALTLTGDGGSERDFIYIDDVVDAFVLAGQSDAKNAVYNLGSGALNTIKTLATLMGGRIEYIPARADDPPLSADCTRARSELGWEPKTAFADGVGITMKAMVQSALT